MKTSFRLVILSSFLTLAVFGQLPDWFTTQTQLCFDWYADGDGGQCSGPSSRLCANVNEKTAYYRDDSDRRAGGCQMRWGIISPNSPEWFRQVQICYRWFADGDNGQCGDHSGRGEVCAGVGDFTPFYRDDTDRRPGGCQMSWRLQVPASAPAWMQTTRLCYSWYAESDGGQCGVQGLANDLCASANYWTQYYRDDTDRRAGGCQMSWSMLLN